MKLLIQSDDYGMTRAVAKGILHGIEHGLIRNTGMFTNMPWATECAEWIMPYLDYIALGIDLNITTGSPILPPDQIPTLVKNDGTFYTSWESRELDKQCADSNHAAYDDVFKEFEAQIVRFIELFGKKPDYIHSHAYGTDRTIEIQRLLAKKYDIIYSSDAWKYIFGYEVPDYRIQWYLKPPTPDNQLASSLKDYILNNEDLLNQKYGLIVGHMGYVDQELMELSTYNLYRLKDLEAVVCVEVYNWIKDHHVELITYKDIVNLMKEPYKHKQQDLIKD